MPHASKAKSKPKAKRPKRKRRRKRKTARIITPGFGDFRRPRRFAHLQTRARQRLAQALLGALAQDLLTPIRPAPNWLTPRAPSYRTTRGRSSGATRASQTPGSAPRCGAR